MNTTMFSCTSRVGYPTQEFILQSKESKKAEFIREHVANSQIMYSEAYTEYDEPDIFDMYEPEELIEDIYGNECELLARVEFAGEILHYEEGY